ncbi:hypothetical protein ACLKA6_004079 [Drosophila palustris]
MDQLCKICDVLFNFLHCENENEIENEACAASSHDVMDTFSYNIKHKYPNRLVTYDAEAIGEPRLIRLSDLTESVMELMMPSCEKEEEKDECEENQEECEENQDECQASEAECKQVKVECDSNSDGDKDECEANNPDEYESKEKNSKIACNFLKSFFPGENLSEARLKQLEQCSKILHERFLQRQAADGVEGSTCEMSTKWESLKPLQKFCFYWQALTGHVLHPTPFENFRDIFVRRYRRKCPQGSEKELRDVVRRCWRCLKAEERVPFNLNALLYHVSTGEVDPFDHCAVRGLLNRWR